LDQGWTVGELSSGFSGVDANPAMTQLLDAMRATASWPAVVELRAHTRPALDVGPGDTVLDVGCGLADVLIDLGRTSHAAMQLTGVDSSAAMLAAAAADANLAGIQLELHQADATALPLSDDSVAAVRSERVLQWVEDPAAAIREMLRVLRPGGSIVLIDTDWRTAAIDCGDPEVEEVLAAVMSQRPGADAGGRLRSLGLDAGIEDIQFHTATAALTWPPGDPTGPGGFLPMPLIPQLLLETLGTPLGEGRRMVDVIVDAGRRDRFLATVSMMAVVGRAPSRT
jgi:SAM-dependent methyltransferase